MKINPNEVGTSEVSETEIGSVQVGSAKISLTEIGPYVWMLLSPLVPSLYSLF